MGKVRFEAITFDSLVKEESKKPAKLNLFGTLWREGELCCLIGDPGTGKTVLGMQIAMALADPERIRHFDYNLQNDSLNVQTEAQTVLYFNFEMDRHQIMERYRSEDGTLFLTEKIRNLVVLNPPRNLETLEQYKEAISSEVKERKAKVIVIDNLSSFTAFGMKAEDVNSAHKIMTWLKGIKEDMGISILLIHHPTKRNKKNEFSLNDISGSAGIGRGIDSAFAIGTNVRYSGNARYLVQIKSRTGRMVYDTNNCALFNLVKNNERLFCSFTGETLEEWQCIRHGDNNIEERDAQILDFYKEGETKASLSRMFSKSHTQISRIVKPVDDERKNKDGHPF